VALLTIQTASKSDCLLDEVLDLVLFRHITSHENSSVCAMIFVDFVFEADRFKVRTDDPRSGICELERSRLAYTGRRSGDLYSSQCIRDGSSCRCRRRFCTH
jgi:hypothetical protein